MNDSKNPAAFAARKELTERHAAVVDKNLLRSNTVFNHCPFRNFAQCEDVVGRTELPVLLFDQPDLRRISTDAESEPIRFFQQDLANGSLVETAMIDNGADTATFGLQYRLVTKRGEANQYVRSLGNALCQPDGESVMRKLSQPRIELS